jgi:predicted dehydrogenase
MRVGIVGGGNISDTHARAAKSIPGVEIAAVYGANAERTAKLAELYGGKAYTDYERFLDHPGIDLVAVGSPSGLHGEQGIAAARRGYHLLVEKPLEITTDRADALIAAADEAGVKLAVFFQDRLRPPIVEMKTMLDAGDLGAPVLISGRVKWHRPPEYYSTSRWRGTWALDGGGALINQAIHTVDLMLWMFGAVARVYGCTATRVHDIEAEDTAAAVLEFANGAIGTIEAGTSIFPGYARRLEITGSQGTIALEDDRLASVELKTGARAVEVPPAPGTAAAVTATVADATPHKRVFEDFIRAIQSGGRPACDGREGRRSVELVQAIYASARSHRPIVPGETT